MSELGYDFLVVALKTVVVCKVFRFMVEAEERCVVAGIGVVLYVAEKVEVVFQLGANVLQLFGSVKADVSVKCLNGFKFVDAMTCERFLRGGVDTML